MQNADTHACAHVYTHVCTRACACRLNTPGDNAELAVGLNELNDGISNKNDDSMVPSLWQQAAMCIDMCVDVCAERCMDMCMDMCVDMCLACTGMCMDRYE